MDDASMSFGSLASTEATHKAIVRQYNLADTSPEAPFDRIVQLATHLFHTPFAALSLSDADRQGFKACVGLDLNEIDEQLAFCSHVAATGQLLVVPDAPADTRFNDSPLVTASPHIRFYAGAPVKVEGYTIGALCVMDTAVRPLSEPQQHRLLELANIVADELTMRRQAREQERLQELQTYQHDILEQIADETPLPEVLANIVFLAETHSPSARGSVMLYDSEERMLRRGAAPNLPDAYTAAIDGLVVGPTVGSCGAAVHHNAQVVTEDIARDPRWKSHRELALTHNLRSCWSTPICDQAGHVLGTFALYYADMRVPAPSEQEMMDAVVQLARVAITHHRQRDSLHTERERLEMTLHGGDLGAWACNFNTRTYTVDARWARMLDYDPDDVAPTLDFFFQLVHPHDRPLFHQAVSAHVQGTRSIIETTLRMRARTGQWRTILTRGKVLTWNEDGTPRRAVGTHTDLTETHQTKEALKEQKEILQMIFDHVPAMISFYTAKGKLNMVNRHWQQVIGWSTKEALQHPNMLQALFPDDGLRAQVRAFLDEAPDAWRDVPVHTRSGAVVDTSWTIVAPTSDLRIAIGIDISDRKQYEEELITAKEEAEEMSRLKSALLANMSHEIRTPLTSIIGFSEVLLGEALAPPANRFVELVHKSGQRLMRTLNSVLNLSQLEAGTVELQPEAFDLAQQLSHLHALFREQAAEKELMCTLTGAKERVPVVLDEGAVHRIVSNLMSNAVKFTEPGGTVTLSLVPEDTEVTLIVRDTGVGIEETFLDRLFDPFRQESTGHHRKYEGSGLGLAITRELVELMHGTIEVDSAKGVGTRFTVRLPRDMHAVLAREAPPGAPENEAHSDH
ncbi:MAG: ATP-binding protein [Bacteroidota bacterium]